MVVSFRLYGAEVSWVGAWGQIRHPKPSQPRWRLPNVLPTKKPASAEAAAAAAARVPPDVYTDANHKAGGFNEDLIRRLRCGKAMKNSKTPFLIIWCIPQGGEIRPKWPNRGRSRGRESRSFQSWKLQPLSPGTLATLAAVEGNGDDMGAPATPRGPMQQHYGLYPPLSPGAAAAIAAVEAAQRAADQAAAEAAAAAAARVPQNVYTFEGLHQAYRADPRRPDHFMLEEVQGDYLVRHVVIGSNEAQLRQLRFFEQPIRGYVAGGLPYYDTRCGMRLPAAERDFSVKRAAELRLKTLPDLEKQLRYQKEKSTTRRRRAASGSLATRSPTRTSLLRALNTLLPHKDDVKVVEGEPERGEGQPALPHHGYRHTGPPSSYPPTDERHYESLNNMDIHRWVNTHTHRRAMYLGQVRGDEMLGRLETLSGMGGGGVRGIVVQETANLLGDLPQQHNHTRFMFYYGRRERPDDTARHVLVSLLTQSPTSWSISTRRRDGHAFRHFIPFVPLEGDHWADMDPIAARVQNDHRLTTTAEIAARITAAGEPSPGGLRNFIGGLIVVFEDEQAEKAARREVERVNQPDDPMVIDDEEVPPGARDRGHAGVQGSPAAAAAAQKKWESSEWLDSCIAAYILYAARPGPDVYTNVAHMLMQAAGVCGFRSLCHGETPCVSVASQGREDGPTNRKMVSEVCVW
ncbi:unnamed protein product [Vitrella brassicaformis CCMP3155]|uniref:Uncharacterized protein n=1 Tax=Vitrella brassicaformis (strain CCMP3155) TaxID=1169540 RepID=A0A0G4FK12_VITBC|nr:unnamed protein product [Vitrella brassicaformis CCMP3155]|eukprot:CEM14049.1 unnamed protein product [Vitrella brassicaformis CCMP3155]